MRFHLLILAISLAFSVAYGAEKGQESHIIGDSYKPSLDIRFIQAEPRDTVENTLVNLQMMKGNVIFRGTNIWGSDTKEAVEIIGESKELIKKAQEKGMKTTAMLGMLAMFPEKYSQKFIDENCTRDPLGAKVKIDNSFYHGCLEKPGWYHNMRELMGLLVKAGIDMIEIDQPALENWRGECYCDECMVAFRQWLMNRYTLEQLNQLLRIKDIESFDYRKELKSSGLAGLSEWDRLRQSRFGHDFWYFQVANNYKRVSELVQYSKNLAREMGKELTVFGNVWGLASEYIPVIPLFDIVDLAGDLRTPEIWEPIIQKTGPPLVSWAPIFKLAKGVGKGKMILSFLDTRGLELAVERFGNLGDLIKLLIGEAAIYGTNYAYPMKNRVAHPLERDFPFDALRESSLFFEKMSPFIQGKTRADVGILVPFSTLLWERFNKHYHGLARILMDEHISFSVIFTGDGVIMEDDLNLENLKKYKAVFMPECYAITDKSRQTIRQYITQGGRILSSGVLDSADSLGYQLARGKDTLNNDRAIERLEVDPFIYSGEKDLAIRKRVVEKLGKEDFFSVNFQNISVDKGDNIRCEYWENENISTLALANANISKVDGLEKLENIHISFAWQGKAPKKITVFLMEEKEGTILQGNLKDGKIDFILPQIRTTALIVFEKPE